MSVKSGKLLSGEELRLAHQSTDQSLPTIGQKDFKPTNSWLEKKQIQTALDEKKQLLEYERVEKLGSLAQAEWYERKKLAEVTVRAGKFAQSMGFEKDGKLCLYPEEALYLLETNCLQLTYHGVAMSIQQAYSLLLCPTDCTLKQYRAYSHLSKQGYRLLRYSKSPQPTAYELEMRLDQHVPQKRLFPDVNVEHDVQTTEVNLQEDEHTSGATEVDLREDQQPADAEAEADAELSEVEVEDDPRSTGRERQVATQQGKSSEKETAHSGGSKEVPLDKRKRDLIIKEERAEENKTAINGPMKDFAKSVADMGKSLVKTEKSDGKQGLGLEHLRQKILDMLENHFQGQISQEAMDAVSLSASNAILVHVEDVDNEKRQTSVETSDDIEDRQDVDFKDNDESSSEMVSDHSRDEGGESRSPEELDNMKESVDLAAEEVPEKSDEAVSVEVAKSGEAESEEVSKKSDEAAPEEVSRESGEAEPEKVSNKSDKTPPQEVSKKSDEAAPEEVSRESGEAEPEKVSNKSDKTPPQEVSEKKDEAAPEEVTKKTDEAAPVEVPMKSDEAAPEEVSKKRDEAAPEEVSKKRDEAAPEEVPKESGEAKSEGDPKKSDGAEAEDVSKKSSDVKSDELSKKSDEALGEISKKSSGLETVEAEPEKKKEAESERLSSESRACEELAKTSEKAEAGSEEKKKKSDSGVGVEMANASKKAEESATDQGSRGKALQKESKEGDGDGDIRGEEINKTDIEKADTPSADCERQSEPKISAKCSEPIGKMTEMPSNEELVIIASQANSGSPNKKGSAEKINGDKRNAESSDEEESLADELEVSIEGFSSQVSSQGTAESSRRDKDESGESDSEILEFQVFDGKAGRRDSGSDAMQTDDDVVEIDDPNSWKNVKVEAPDKASNKRPFPDSNGWRSFKKSQTENPSKKAKLQKDGDGVAGLDISISAVRADKDIEIIDISEEVNSAKPAAPKDEIEVVDLDESESGSESDSSEEKPDVKQENKIVHQRPKLASAFERARDSRRKAIMDSFPNMIDRPVLTVQVPQTHLLPPNVNPIQSTYTLQRRAIFFDRPYRPQKQMRRYFNPTPRFNNHFQPRQQNQFHRFRAPMNQQVWPLSLMQGTQNMNPAALQAFQMITSIVLPMFGINNVARPFRAPAPQSWSPAPMGSPMGSPIRSPMGSPMGSPMWQQRPWQNNQPWRFQQRQPWNNNRFNRPWPNQTQNSNRNQDRDRDEEAVPERPKRPALLPTPGSGSGPGQASPPPGSWINDRMIQPDRSESRRPKRPFLLDNTYSERRAKNAKELLADIEDELCWKKIRIMNEGSDSDSGDEVTITPIQPNNRTKSSKLQPLLKLDQCTSSASIMESLQIIEKADPRTLKVSGQNRILKISYDMFLPNVPLKKSLLTRPNFRLCIMGVEEQLPSPGDMSVLLDEVHDNVPLLFAIVHPDGISFYNYSQVDLPKQTFST